MAHLALSDFHGYQHRMVDRMIEVPKSGMWADMGLGKTASSLTAVDRLLQCGKAKNILVAAPLRVARTIWHIEALKWEHLEHLTFNLMAGLTPKRRLDAMWDMHYDIHVINIQLLPWLIEQYGHNWPFDTVIIDESSCFKETNTVRFKAFRRISGIIPNIIELTGTPAPNDLIDIWPQLYLLDRGERLEKTKKAYLWEYFIPVTEYDWALRKGAEEKIHELVSDICVSLKQEDYLDMPPVTENDVFVELDAKARRLYKKMAKEYIITYGDGKKIPAANAAVVANKLIQIASGFIYNEEKEAIFIHDLKLDALDEIIAGTGGSVLVAFNYTEDCDRILKRLPTAQKLGDDPEQIFAFQRGEIPILVAHAASAGHGIELQFNCRNVIWYTPTWSNECYRQFNKRVARQGQEYPVTIHRILTKDSYDERVIKVLETKEGKQQALLASVKAELEDA